MTDVERKTAYYDMLYLTSCGVNGTAPDRKRIGQMNLENVYSVSKVHLLNAVTYYALESAELPDNEILKKWRESKDKAIRKNMMLDAGRGQIAKFLDSIGCRYMPLKGVYLQGIYPRSGMRQMSDNDILFEEKFRNEVRRWFLDNGYKSTKEEKENHGAYDDAYEKAPVYNYEMHISLFNPDTRKRFYDYYADIFERLIRNDTGYGCRFSDEDFYIYLTAHSFKHYDNAGTGLRSLLDVYVFDTAKREKLDREYIEKESEKLGIADFEKQCRELSIKIFSDPDNFSPDQLRPDELEMLERFLFAGAYGNLGNIVVKRSDELVKKTGSLSMSGYIKSRIFLDMETVRIEFPFFYRHKILLPILWIKRIFKALTVHRKRTFSELRTLKKIK